MQAFDEWGRVTQETLVIRMADNFLCYLSDALRLVFKNRPEMLRSKQQVRLEFVLQFPDMDSLIEAVADRRIDSLAYKSLDELGDTLQQEIGLSIFTSDEMRKTAVLAVARRNLIVHNRGVINARWIQAGGDGADGAYVDLHGPIIRNTANVFTEAVCHIDTQLVSKFGLRATRKVFVADDWLAPGPSKYSDARD